MYMKMKKIYLLMMLGILLISCNKTNNNIAESSGQVEVINLISSTQKNFSEVFSSFEIIPLETNDSSLVGRRISKMEFYKNKIYLLNVLSSRKNILCFDSSGKFLFVIDKIGSGPEEYTHLEYFFIDYYQEKLVLICEAGELMHLNMDGNYIVTKNSSEKSYLTQMFALSDTVYLGSSDEELPPVGFNLIQFDSNSLEIKQKSDKLKEGIPSIMGNFCMTYYKNNVYYYNNINDTIYNVTNMNSMEVSYYINSGKDTQNAKKQLKAFASKDYNQFLNFFQKLFTDKGIKLVSSFYMNSGWVAINIIEPKEKYKAAEGVFVSTIFYDKKTKESYSSANIIFDIFNIKEAINDIHIIGSSDDTFYFLIKNEFTEKQKEQIKQSKLTKEEKEILINHEDENNPIMIKITI